MDPLISSLHLVEKVSPNALSQVIEESQQLAKVRAAHLGDLSIHISILVEDLEQVSHLVKCLIVPSHLTSLEAGQDLIDGFHGIGAICEHLVVYHNIAVAQVAASDLVLFYLAHENHLESLLDLALIDFAIAVMFYFVELFYQSVAQLVITHQFFLHNLRIVFFVKSFVVLGDECI